MSNLRTLIASNLHSELSSQKSPLASEKREAMRNNGSELAQLKLRTLGALCLLAPGTVQAALRLPYTRRGYEHIGSGYHSDVIKLDGHVVKIDRHSRKMSAREQTDHAKKLADESELTEGFLSDLAETSTFDIIADPLKPKEGTVVVARQQYFESEPVDFLDVPSYTDQTTQDLRDLCLKAISMHSQIGTMPDLVAHGNIRVAPDGQVRLVDTGLLNSSSQAFPVQIEYNHRVLALCESKS